MKYGVKGFQDELFKDFLLDFDYFLIYGNTDRSRVTRKLMKMEELIRKIHKMDMDSKVVDEESEEEKDDNKTIKNKVSPSYYPSRYPVEDDGEEGMGGLFD